MYKEAMAIREDTGKEHKKFTCKTPCIIITVFFVVTFIGGLLIGHFGIPKGSLRIDEGANGQSQSEDGTSKGGNGNAGKPTPSPNPGLNVSQMVHDNVMTENLRKNLRSVLSKSCNIKDWLSNLFIL